MKRLTASLALLLLLTMAYAQDISSYEYWTDDDYASRTTVEATSSEVMLSVSTAQMAAGIHFLNFRALRSDGVWGNFCRYLYYIPTLKATTERSVSVEYWLDDSHVDSKREDATDNQLSLAIDVSQLKEGVHFFNCTAIGSDGERGNSERYLFYVPRSIDYTTVASLTGYEYWFDDDYQNKTMHQGGESEQVLAVSIDGLASGIHFFNCRAVNELGEWSNPIRKMFYIPDTKPMGNATLAAAEYWIDDDHASKVSVKSSDVQQSFSIDISSLSSGIHYFNYRAIDSKGRYGNLVRQLFYIAKSPEMATGGAITYEYWIDDDLAGKVTGEAAQSELVFSIDISKLDQGSHTFNFRAQYMFGEWGEPFTAEFTKSIIKGDVNGDGIVDVADIATIISVMAAGDKIVETVISADVNEDGVVDVADIATIISIMAEMARQEQLVED